MLNISTNKLNKKVDLSGYRSYQMIFEKEYHRLFRKVLGIFFGICFLILFLPWTQSVTGFGLVTTLSPDQRPQTIHSVIPGRVEKWYVREGDYVAKGDTILFISEVKDEYFDPELLDRTEDQLKAKELSITSYENKVEALEGQIGALKNERALKLEQAANKLLQSKLKVTSDSIDLEAARTNLSIAQRQYERVNTLQQEGLKAVTEVEEKKLKLQETQAKLISQENKLLGSRNEVINAEVELGRLKAEYSEKISKAESDKYTAMGAQYEAEGALNKLKNTRTNYEVRQGMHFVRAPQNGYINKALQSGIGETFKEGEPLVSIMPSEYDIAVDAYVSPIDLPLLHLDERVRIQFDGWPAIVFSGWPNLSYGTYAGRVVAIETFASENGKYRVLIAPDPDDHPWPDALRVGSGARTIALLEDVPIWFEIWRQLNGFPPNFYQPEDKVQKDKKE